MVFSNMRELLGLRPYIYRYRWIFIGGILCAIFADFFAVLGPQAAGFVVDALGGAGVRYRSVWVSTLARWLQGDGLLVKVSWGASMVLVFAIVRGVFMFYMRWLLVGMSRRIEYDLKNDLYQKYQVLDNAFYDRTRVGDMMNRLGEDVSRVRMCVGPVFMYLTNLSATFVFCFYFMVRTSATLSFVSVLPLPILFYCILRFHRLIARASEAVQEDLSAMMTLSTEIFRGIRIIQSFRQEKRYWALLSNLAGKHARDMSVLVRGESLYFALIYFLIHTSTILSVGVGGYMVVRGQLALSVVLEFVFYINLMTSPFLLVGLISSMVEKSSVSYRRIRAFLDEPVRMGSPVVPAAFPSDSQDIKLRGLRFRYQQHDRFVLNGVDANIRAGQKVAIIGPTGSGKSTLMKLFLRFYDPQEGDILLGQTDIRQLAIEQWRAHIAYVSQEVGLFRSTIHDNLCLEIADSSILPPGALEKAAQTAEILDEILTMPDGWQSVLGENGLNLSGGQCQRLALARTLVCPKPLLLLDNPLSAVDFSLEAKILSNLRTHNTYTTLIHITQRPLREYYYDQVFVLENGRITQSGDEKTLRASSGWYRDVFLAHYKEKAPE